MNKKDHTKWLKLGLSYFEYENRSIKQENVPKAIDALEKYLSFNIDFRS